MTASVPSYLEEIRSQTEQLIQESRTSDLNLETLAREWQTNVLARQDRLSQDLADLYAKFVGHVSQIQAIKDDRQVKEGWIGWDGRDSS